MSGPRVVSVDDICEAIEQVLIEHLRPVVTVLGWDEDLREITTWVQVPTLPALTSAKVPVGAITSGGLAEPPKRNGNGSYDVTWRVAVGVWDRGDNYRSTARRIRRHAAAVRATLARHKSLGGVADSLTWVSENYDEIVARNSARTIGGAVCGFNVLVKNALDPYSLDSAGPLVTSTNTPVTIRTPEE